MAGVNKVILIGNLGRDPETKYTGSGNAVCKFSIATSYKKKGEDEEQTEWHNIVAFGKLAEICEQYLKKGKQVYIEGRMQTSNWEQDGITRYKTEVIAENMTMLGNKADNYESPGPDFSTSGTRDPKSYTETKLEENDNFDPEIPF